MFQRDIPHLPIKIERCQFVNIVFALGLIHRHGYDTIVTAAQLGDMFVSYSGARTPFTDCFNNSSDNAKFIDILSNPVPQEYSEELAYAVTVIAAKANEDDGYKSIEDAIVETGNRYVLKIEYEICMLLNFHVKIHNFITVIGMLLSHKECVILGSGFWDLSRQICMDPILLKMNPLTLVVGIILLCKSRKLRAIRDNKERVFSDIMTQVSKEYELELTDVLKEYIAIKQNKTC